MPEEGCDIKTIRAAGAASLRAVNVPADYPGTHPHINCRTHLAPLLNQADRQFTLRRKIKIHKTSFPYDEFEL
jgi:hypothetical protein